jgi:D-alanyl-D-alanine endopeptidase (penicillin-binding protein 7)
MRTFCNRYTLVVLIALATTLAVIAAGPGPSAVAHGTGAPAGANAQLAQAAPLVVQQVSAQPDSSPAAIAPTATDPAATSPIAAKLATTTLQEAQQQPLVASYPLFHRRQKHADVAQRVESSKEVEALTRHVSLRSESALVLDLTSSAVLYSKNSDEVRPIASISKLMTALVVIDAHQPMNQVLEVTDADVDRLKYSRSRLRVGSKLTRAMLLHLALMSSENRAAHALARNYPGGLPAFVRAMNDKARSLGMRHTHYVEPTGLSSDNVSTPRDLVKLLRVVAKVPLIHKFTTDDTETVEISKGRTLVYNNTNSLVRSSRWNIDVSKTGFINESGECLVMLARIDKRPVAIVLLDSTGHYSRIGDARRVRHLVKKEINVAML